MPKITRLNTFAPIDNDLINSEQVRLFRIHDTLVGKFAKLYLNTTSLRSLHDSLFIRILNIRVPRKRFARLATFLATRFCQGITFFANNGGRNSCGPLSGINRTNKYFVKNCYIERMIYNYIYNHVFYEQDIGHMHELKNIERIYQDFYKNENLAIQVIFSSDQLHPHQLIITTTKLNDQPIVEIYTKPYDTEIVDCIKYIGSQKYEKTQTFLKESNWIVKSA